MNKINQRLVQTGVSLVCSHDALGKGSVQVPLEKSRLKKNGNESDITASNV